MRGGFEPCQSRAATEGSEHVWLRFESLPSHCETASEASGLEYVNGERSEP